MEKGRLRQEYKAIRAAEDKQTRTQADSVIAETVLKSPEFNAADWILSYLAFGEEVETRGIIQAAWDKGKHVALPRCIVGTRQMTWYEVTDFGGLSVSQFGIEEPDPIACCEVPLAVFENPQALALVPGIAFDTKGYRLGYGGGYYDRFLPVFVGVSVGVCRKCQLVESLTDLGVLDSYDVAVDKVISA